MRSSCKWYAYHLVKWRVTCRLQLTVAKLDLEKYNCMKGQLQSAMNLSHIKSLSLCVTEDAVYNSGDFGAAGGPPSMGQL